MKKNLPVIAITTGDVDGVGLEVTLKALLKVRSIKRNKFKIFCSSIVPASIRPLLRKVERTYSSEYVEFVASDKNPATWVEEAGKKCLAKQYAAIVTGPLSKLTIAKAGYSAIGHTEILNRLSKCDDVYMTFLGQHFNVVLLSGHTPIKDVSAQLTVRRIVKGILLSYQFRKYLSKGKNKQLALVGLNPHAGEEGLIGLEEQTLYKEIFANSALKKIRIEGPLVPDAAFLRSQWSKYSFYLCPYHDQGLIPFKLVHGQDGAHLSLGLPFVRTSVDHGTAKDIFGKNIANADSMVSAILWAQKLS